MRLALKYRPHQFSDLVGQEHVSTVLKETIKRQAVPAGLIFSGTRGTGKTTTARILAASLNCTNRPQSSSEPCGQCDYCKAVESSNCQFVHEIDAASNNSVDNIRTLKESALYSHEGDWRIFILDEAHNLSKSAFEALLKQIEEPPPNTAFVMATTNPDDIPDTIMSRSMRFDFKRMSVDLTVKRLKYICQCENINIQDEKILYAISERATGAMRDAIMCLEQLSNYKADLTLQDFYQYFGLVGKEVYIAMIDLARKADIITAKKLIQDNFSRGVDVGYFLDTFLDCVGDDLATKVLNDEQAIAVYRAAVEIKSRLKHLNADTAMMFLMTLLLRAFHVDVSVGKVEATVDDFNTLMN